MRNPQHFVGEKLSDLESFIKNDKELASKSIEAKNKKNRTHILYQVDFSEESENRKKNEIEQKINNKLRPFLQMCEMDSEMSLVAKPQETCIFERQTIDFSKSGKPSSKVAQQDDISTASPKLPEDQQSELDLSSANIELIELVGSGAFGCVYLGQIKSTGFVLAVKVLFDVDGSDLKFAMNEAMVGARLKHESIVGIYDLRKVGSSWLILMEFVKGESLRLRLKEPLKLGGETIERLVEAVRYLNENSIVHRDIKPDNILLREDQYSPVICDFGLALDTRFHESNNACSGTPFYMPPESFRGIISAAFDIYSLGITLAEQYFDRCDLDYPSDLGELVEWKQNGKFQTMINDVLKNQDSAQWISGLINCDPEQRMDYWRQVE
ncbi:MAG: protein kinase [Planctomycetota bacterium]